MAFCKRCGREFLPKKEGLEYGSVYTRKLAGQVELTSMALVSGKVLRPKKETKYEYKKRKAAKAAPEREPVCRVCGCTDLTPCPGGCAWVKPDLCSACATDEELMS